LTRHRLLVFALTTLVACLGQLGLPSSADAQQSASLRHIGFVLVAFSPERKELQAFRRGLSDAGYSEGRDMVIDWQLAGGDYAKVPQLVADLVQRKVDVLVVESTLAARAAKQATSTIPIVMSLVGDPVGSGLVTSLAHPGGNLTGLSLMTAELSVKRLELVKETVPQVKRVAILWNPDVPWHAKAVQDLEAVAPGMSIELKVMAARGPKDFGAAFSAAKRAHVQATYVLESANYWSYHAELLSAVSKARIPAIYGQRDFAEVGGLMSYGTNFSDIFRRSAGYVDKILKGANPGESSRPSSSWSST
jgi:ABC-type uncharacterized transport system substrate-binding protein